MPITPKHRARASQRMLNPRAVLHRLDQTQPQPHLMDDEGLGKYVGIL